MKFNFLSVFLQVSHTVFLFPMFGLDICVTKGAEISFVTGSE